jgi:hypothetical protein
VAVVVYAVYISSQISGRMSEIIFPPGAVTYLFAAAAASTTRGNSHRPARMFLYGCWAAETLNSPLTSIVVRAQGAILPRTDFDGVVLN